MRVIKPKRVRVRQRAGRRELVRIDERVREHIGIGIGKRVHVRVRRTGPRRIARA